MNELRNLIPNKYSVDSLIEKNGEDVIKAAEEVVTLLLEKKLSFSKTEMVLRIAHEISTHCTMSLDFSKND